MIDRQYLLYLKIGGLLAVPLLLLLLPADYFDQGQSLCLSMLLLDTKCLGCGITRAIQHLIHFEFEAAYSYNPLSFIVLPVLMYLWIKQFVQSIKQLR